MRKLVGILVSVALMAPATFGLNAAHGKKQRAREVQLHYDEPTLGIQFPTYAMVWCFSGCPVFDIYPGERYVTLSSDDALSEDVALAVFPWDGNTQEPGYTEHHYCTTTDQPLKLPRWAVALWVEALIGPCADGTPATATEGTITAVFSASR